MMKIFSGLLVLFLGFAVSALADDKAVKSPTSQQAVNRLLGVNASGTGISPRASDYIYSPGVRSSSYGSLYGRPNYSRYESITSRVRKSNLRRSPSVYQSPYATNIFYPNRIVIRK